MKKLSKKGNYYYCAKVNENRNNDSLRTAEILEESESILDFSETERCTASPKDTFIEVEGVIVDNVLHMKKQLYSKAL